MEPTPNQPKSVHALFYKLCFNIILPYHLAHWSGLFPSAFTVKNLYVDDATLKVEMYVQRLKHFVTSTQLSPN